MPGVGLWSLMVTFPAYTRLFLKKTKQTKQSIWFEMVLLIICNILLTIKRTGADPGFLESGYIYINVWGFVLLILSHFLKYPMKMKIFGLTEAKLFIFIGYLKSGGGGGGGGWGGVGVFERTPYGSVIDNIQEKIIHYN